MIGKICNVLTAILLVILLALAAVLAGPYLFGCRTFSVLTGSMEPEMPVGSLLIVNIKASPEDIAPKDVITFSLGGETLATHRVMEKNDAEGHFITKGDANNADDGPVEYNRLVGKVLLCIPKLGVLATTIQSKRGIPIIAGLLIVIVLLTFLPEIFKKENSAEGTK